MFRRQEIKLYKYLIVENNTFISLSKLKELGSITEQIHQELKHRDTN